MTGHHPVNQPLGKTITTKKKSLQDLKYLLEDRGEDRVRQRWSTDTERDSNNSYDNNCFSVKLFRRWCLSRVKTVMILLLVFVLVDCVSGRSSEPRYETAYACEGKTLKIGCREGSVIHLIRANYGRFSITICNDHGNTDWSVNCMSTKSLRVLHSRCSMHQNCSILASTNMFGDPCPNTLKYLEAHYQCVPASTTSTTNRPSPPWLITSQPTVWRSTQPPVPKNPVQTQQNERKKPTVITPPTFRPHITLPPEVKLGDVTKKTTTRQPDSSSERDPPQSPRESIPEVKEEVPKVVEQDHSVKNDKPKEDEPAVTEGTLDWPSKDEDMEPTPSVHLPPKDNRQDTDIVDDFDRAYSTSATPNIGRRAYCPQVTARGLNWNWTLVNSYAVQPCPGGATGLARWKCTLTAHQYIEEERPRRRNTGLPSGENYHDLGLEQPSDRQMQLIRRLGSEALLKADAIPEWLGPTPDLSECRSVWLNSLEARVREGESLLSISNDLAQVTSSKTLYGGDMMTTTSIMKKLAQRMSQNVQTFPDPRQREAIVTDMLLGVIKTGSNLLEESQRSSWADLNVEAQSRAASALLTQLEENAFLLADAVTKEKTILQIVKNICLSVRVLEVKNVEDETFPSIIAQEQWKGSEDTITIPKAALLENRQNELVRIVFFAFDRLEEILPPTFGKSPRFVPFLGDVGTSSSTSINSEREKKNITKVLNSKVISASLGNGRHIELSQMVQITMKHLKTENVTNPACVFWDYTLHGWSPEGCVVEWSNTTHTGCACSHLTNFAILMDVRGVALGAGHEQALTTLTYIGCGISTVALSAAIIVFMCFRNGKQSDRALIHKNLCFCLLVAEIVFLAGIDKTQNRIFCGLIAGVLHYFFLAAFAWMFLEGFHLYAMLVEVFEPEHPRGRWYCTFAYLAPALVVLVSAAIFPGGYGTDRHCWLTTDRWFMMSFVGPVILVLVANWICLIMVIYMMCTHSTVSLKAKDDAKLYKMKVWLKSSIVLAFLLGLTWTFGLLYLSEQTVVMAYAFTILNSLQGLVIFIFHCLQNDKFRNECARIGRRHPWLSCCLHFTGQPSETLQHNNGPTASSSNHMDTRQGSVKSRRYHQSNADVDDVVDPRDVTSYSLQPEGARWNIRPTAPIYVPSDDARSMRVPTPQNIPHSTSHTQSIASMHSYRNNIEVPNEYQNLRSRSPSCFSNKMAASIGANDWAVMANANVWKNTSSKHHPGNSATLQHHDTLSRQLAQQNHIHSPYECDAPLAPGSPRHVMKDEESPLHHPQGYQTTRSYNHDFRNPHVYMSQHSPGSQEMIFRKHYKDDRRKHHHHHGSQNINHTYSEIASQQGRMYRRGSEQEFRVIQDDPVYEEIERNETLMSDMSDDNSGPDNCRQNPGHHGSSSSKFFGDHRPLISYSPGDRHHHEQEHYGKYGKWDTLERYDQRHYESGRLMHPYHQPQESNMRALAAVLNGENNVVCHLEPHNSYDVYQPQSGNPRTVSQPSF
ncbi:calcium-independent receptor for alpha-latrotoxin isoform X4 [Anticarsia gemmatalis]|uniref:calcium-independent receptor for alpha-latrotoxin isoform X4 n=1 Tax=Anticarsia gemmatalis TaxID=129554 RepID=UPI003F762545